MADTRKRWAGRIISGFVVLFLVFDASMKLMRLPVVLEATRQLGFPAGSIVFTGMLLLACTAVYVVPRTAAVGAVLLTGYLGGAVSAQLRVGHPLFETLFPIVVGSLLWAGLYFRDGRVRALVTRS